MKHHLAGDVIAAWHGKKTALLRAWKHPVWQGQRTDRAELADMLLDGIDGLKMRAKTSEERHDGAKSLVRLVVG